MSEEQNPNIQENQPVQVPCPPDYNYQAPQAPVPPAQPTMAPQYQQYPPYAQQYPPQYYQAPPQQQMPQQQPYPPYVQPYYVPTYVKPPRPGRGFGIASMVLGIFGVIYSFMAFSIALTTSPYNGYVSSETFTGNIFAFIAFVSIFAILSCVFSISALKKGYKNGISMAGLIMSVLSVGLIFLSVVCAVLSSY